MVVGVAHIEEVLVVEREGWFGRAVVVVLALAVLATLVDAAVARRQERLAPRVLAVRAEAEVEAEPDIARIKLGVKAVLPTPKEAATKVAEKTKAIKGSLAKLGVAADAVETSELYLGEVSEYDYEQKRTVKLGYKAYHWLRVTLKNEDFPRLAAVVDGAVAAGATTFSDLRFEVEEDNPLRAQALADATARAREKAEAMAKAAGARIVGIQGISQPYATGWGYAARGIEYEAAEEAAPAEPAVESIEAEPEVPAALRITAEVEVAFLLG